MFLFSRHRTGAQGPDPDRYIVKFKDGQGAQGLAAVLARQRRIAARAAAPECCGGAPARPGAGRAGENPHIEYIERDPPRYPMAEITPYGIPMVQADPFGTDAERLGPGSEPRKVCVIDSGYDLGHPDLAHLGQHLGTRPTGHGHLRPRHPRGGHHRRLAGNNEGVVGVFGKGPVSTFNVKVFGDNCSWSYASSLVDAANQCREAGANVINMSLGCIDSRGGPYGLLQLDGGQRLPGPLRQPGHPVDLGSAGNAATTQLWVPGLLCIGDLRRRG
jgi:serine protease